MCRIVGAIGRKLDSPFISNIFLESEHLGRDATGFWFPNTNIMKGPKKVSEFLPEAKEVFEEGMKNSHVFLGHTRLATHGKPEFNYNNHPIESENWIVVHNGIVHMKDISDYPYTSDTDTENILAYIETFGLEKGLEYCTSGASIILVNKAEEDTLYLWRTATGDMAIAYDLDKENIYISSGSRYFWAALKPEVKEVKRLGGLFSFSKRRMRVTEPDARQLWKLSFKDKQVHAEKIAAIKSFYSTDYNNRNYCAGFEWQKRFDDKGLFTTLGYGKNRPAMKEGRIKIEEKKTTSNYKSITKSSNGDNYHEKLYVGDVVKFKRKLTPTDIVNCTKAGLIRTLTAETEFTVQKFLTDSRVILERGDDGEIFTAPKEILKLVPTPYCIGILYNPCRVKCRDCIFKQSCLELVEAYKDTPKPPCLGDYDPNDEDCMACTFLTPCLREVENKDYIDADFKEVNSTVVKEETNDKTS